MRARHVETHAQPVNCVRKWLENDLRHAIQAVKRHVGDEGLWHVLYGPKMPK